MIFVLSLLVNHRVLYRNFVNAAVNVCSCNISVIQ